MYVAGTALTSRGQSLSMLRECIPVHPHRLVHCAGLVTLKNSVADLSKLLDPNRLTQLLVHDLLSPASPRVTIRLDLRNGSST